MRRILPHRPETLRYSRRTWSRFFGALAIAATLGALALAGVFSPERTSPPAKRVLPTVSTKTLKALERVRRQAKQPPLYYLGLHFDGLPLVGVIDEQPVNLVYADCTILQLNTFDPACRRGLSVELWKPAPGEITTWGRCTFSDRVRGATVARFPSNPQTLWIFTKRTTVDISSRSLRDDLAAARALRGLNVRLATSEPLPSRDVSRLLGHCRAPKRLPHGPPLTPKRRYELQMQGSWTPASASELSLPDLGHLADNHAVEQEFLANVSSFPLLLRNEATRLGSVRPPADVADLQARLIAELRAYADDVDAALGLVRSGAWHDTSTYRSEQKNLEARFARHSKEILATIASFQKRGYVIAIKRGD